MLSPNDIVIDDSNANLFVRPNSGLVQRDFSAQPLGCMANVPAMSRSTYDRATWPERIRDAEASKTRLSDIAEIGNYGKPIPPMWQDGWGFCWNHSFVAGVQLAFAISNLPYVRLSAFAGACLIKGYRNVGGMSIDAAQFAAENGVASAEFWPQPEYEWTQAQIDACVNRKWDTPAMRANAKKRALLEYEDVPHTLDHMFTNLFDRRPTTGEFSWWGHSVLQLDPVEVDPSKDLMDPRRWGTRILNSHGPNNGANGRLVLVGAKGLADLGGVAIKNVRPSSN
jgi:hypothetical protein